MLPEEPVEVVEALAVPWQSEASQNKEFIALADPAAVLTGPVIIRCADFMPTKEGSDVTGLKEDLDLFKQEYELPSNKLRTNPGRAQKKMSGSLAKDVQHYMSKLLGSSHTEPGTVHAYAVTAGSGSLQVESKSAPTARWSYSGSRHVLAVSQRGLEAAMKAVGVDGKRVEE